jgi:hypothetical protein
MIWPSTLEQVESSLCVALAELFLRWLMAGNERGVT